MARARTGQIVERDGKIYARVRFKDDTGKKRDLWRKADNRTHARQILRELLNETERTSAAQLDAANMTFEELAEHYIAHYLQPAQYVGDKKVSGVRGVVPALCAVKPLVAHFGTRKIRAITYGDLKTYKETRLKTPTRYGTQRSIAAVNKELSKAKRMFGIAVREQWLQRSPFANGESLIGDEMHRTRLLSREEEARLFATIEAEPKRAHLKGICMMALDCALRRGEIFTLRWSDVDLERRTVTVRAFNSKTARSRTIAMTSRVYAELARLWQESTQDVNALVFGVSVTIKTAWKKICRDAGLEDFHFHDCRATAISRMISAGMAPAEVMRVSGHTTLRAFYIYVRTDLDAAFRAASVLDAYLAQTAQAQDGVSEMVN
jgi:integrase